MFRITLGVVLAVLGVLGLVLPILKGILFLVASVFVLSIDVPVFRRLRRRLARRYPAVFGRVERWFTRKRPQPPAAPAEWEKRDDDTDGSARARAGARDPGKLPREPRTRGR